MYQERNISKRSRWSAVVLLAVLISLFAPVGATPQDLDSCSIQPGSRQVSAEQQELESIYDEVWSLIQDYFLYQKRLESWSQWRHRYDGKLSNRRDLAEAIDSMIDSLADEYTFYRNQEDTRCRHCLEEKKAVVQSAMLQGRIAYIHLSTFNSAHCVDETETALKKLQSASAFILDLRDNGGGCIDRTFEIFSLFNNSGVFVFMEGPSGSARYREELRLEPDAALTVSQGETVRGVRKLNYTGNKPLVVIVDKTTKSAAEMLAGALRDNGRAMILGSRTFGKGIVQRVWEFPIETSIKVSWARYYLPAGEFIHRVGLEPDLVVRQDRASGCTARAAEIAAANSSLDPEAGSCHDKQLLYAYRAVRQKLITMAGR